METLAPWAEPVLMTAEELSRLPEDGWRYELVEGRLVRMSPTGPRHGEIGIELVFAVASFIKQHRLGTMYAAETGFWISPPGEADTVLAPDFAFIRADRMPDRSSDAFLRLPPDLVAEVASPSQRRTEMAAKARRWLSAGVRLVWIVLPEPQLIEVWSDGELRDVLTTSGELSGGDVLPGFTCPVECLFP